MVSKHLNSVVVDEISESIYLGLYLLVYVFIWTLTNWMRKFEGLRPNEQ